jgi:polyhydroxybutyrate depolymerase
MPTASRDGMAWIIPGAPLPGEQAPRTSHDDVAFLASLLSAVQARTDLPSSRIHLIGYSGGGRLACQVASELPNLLASVVAVAGVRSPATERPSTPIRLLAIHSRLDPINAFSGGLGPRWSESVEDAVASWARFAGCTDPPTRRLLAETATESRYHNGNTEPVRLIELADGGHAWPGSSDQEHIATYGQAAAFSATAAAWEFIAQSA